MCTGQTHVQKATCRVYVRPPSNTLNGKMREGEVTSAFETYINERPFARPPYRSRPSFLEVLKGIESKGGTGRETLSYCKERFGVIKNFDGPFFRFPYKGPVSE